MKRQAQYTFRLYVARDAQNSIEAQANLRAICRTHLQDRHHIEVIDVFKQPDRALADRVFLTPTLIRTGPLPARTIVGTLSHTPTVLRALGLEPPA